MATASVTANSRNSRPTTSPINSSGISTAISEKVSEMMVKPICPGAFQRGRQRLFAFLDVARDVLDHDDGVVHHEAGGDGQRHQRQVVDRKAEERNITAKVPTSDSGTATPGIMVAGTLRRNR